MEASNVLQQHLQNDLNSVDGVVKPKFKQIKQHRQPITTQEKTLMQTNQAT